MRRELVAYITQHLSHRPYGELSTIVVALMQLQPASLTDQVKAP